MGVKQEHDLATTHSMLFGERKICCCPCWQCPAALLPVLALVCHQAGTRPHFQHLELAGGALLEAVGARELAGRSRAGGPAAIAGLVARCLAAGEDGGGRGSQ
jgi:hypothetical protein